MLRIAYAIVVGSLFFFATTPAFAQSVASSMPGYGSSQPEGCAGGIPTGIFVSDAFYPSPLELTIEGVDVACNVNGSLWGMGTVGPVTGIGGSNAPGNASQKRAYSRWEWTFGASHVRLHEQCDVEGRCLRIGTALATARSGAFSIAFPTGGRYELRAISGGFDGKWVGPKKREIQVTFRARLSG